jgi:hypothetical protein
MQVTSSVREPLVTGGKTLKDVTHDVSRQVEGKPSVGWLLGLLVAVGALGLRFHCTMVNPLGRYRYVGAQQNSRLGLGYHQLRMVGRYWSRRYFDLSRTFAFQTKMENPLTGLLKR